MSWHASTGVSESKLWLERADARRPPWSIVVGVPDGGTTILPAVVKAPGQHGPWRYHEVMWAPWQGAGIEHLKITGDDRGLMADGLVVGIDEGGNSYRFRYLAELGPTWGLSRVQFEDRRGSSPRGWGLSVDPDGTWRNDQGQALPPFEGCLEVDISLTPFTNTLAIRRLGLAIGESADLDVLYVKAPELEMRRVEQRYTRLGDRTYRYEGLFRDFEAELEVDDLCLVLDYPETFRRVWQRP